MHELQTIKMVGFSWLKLIVIFGVVAYRFSKRTQRIFKYGDIPNISFTRDNELNIFIYWTPSYLTICIQELYTF